MIEIEVNILPSVTPYLYDKVRAADACQDA